MLQKTTVGKWCYAHAVVEIWLWYLFLPLDVSGVLPQRQRAGMTDNKVNGGCHVMAAPIFLNVPSKCSEKCFLNKVLTMKTATPTRS